MKNFDKSKNDFILKVSNSDCVDRIWTEETVSKDFIDWNDEQTLDQFSNHTKAISYSSDDFLIQVNKEIRDQIKNNSEVDFCNISCFGWYLNKNHRVQTKLYESSNPNKLQNLKNRNPAIESRSFDQFRSSYRPQKVRNMLNGAFGLSYHFYKEDYDNFFKKINWEKDAWFLNTDKLTPFDRQILIQLFLYQDSRKRKVIDTITNGSDALKLYYDILNHAKEYFLYNSYSMNGFLEYLSNNIENDDVVKDITKLNEIYIKKGLSYKPLIKHTKIIQEFLDLAKGEKSNLINSLGENNNKSSVFLLGMLHMGNRLESQFEFDNFIPSIVTLTMEHIMDIYNEEKYIVIGLNDIEVKNNRNNKFSYVKEYFNELKHIERLKKELQIVKETVKKTDTEYKSTIDQLDFGYTEDTDGQKKPSKVKEISCSKTPMHEEFHSLFHPNPQQARYLKKKSPLKKLVLGVKFFLKKFAKSFYDFR